MRWWWQKQADADRRADKVANRLAVVAEELEITTQQLRVKVKALKTEPHWETGRTKP